MTYSGICRLKPFAIGHRQRHTVTPGPFSKDMGTACMAAPQQCQYQTSGALLNGPRLPVWGIAVKHIHKDAPNGCFETVPNWRSSYVRRAHFIQIISQILPSKLSRFQEWSCLGKIFRLEYFAVHLGTEFSSTLSSHIRITQNSPQDHWLETNSRGSSTVNFLNGSLNTQSMSTRLLCTVVRHTSLRIIPLTRKHCSDLHHSNPFNQARLIGHTDHR